jgi:hypothetical protein
MRCVRHGRSPAFFLEAPYAEAHNAGVHLGAGCAASVSAAVPLSPRSHPPPFAPRAAGAPAASVASPRALRLPCAPLASARCSLGSAPLGSLRAPFTRSCRRSPSGAISRRAASSLLTAAPWGESGGHGDPARTLRRIRIMANRTYGTRNTQQQASRIRSGRCSISCRWRSSFRQSIRCDGFGR